MGKAGDKAAVDALIERLQSQYEAREIRTEAAKGLGLLRDTRAVEHLRCVASDTKEAREVRLASIGALGRMGDTDGLIVNLKADDIFVRRQAVEALGACRDKRAADVLHVALADNDTKVRSAAAAALGRSGAVSSCNALVPLLQDEDYEVVCAAAASLLQLGDSRGSERISESLKDDPRCFMQGKCAAIALVKIDDKRGAEYLRRHLNGIEFSERRSVVDSLRGVATPAAVSVLRDCLYDRDPAIVARAGEALKEMHGLRVRYILWRKGTFADTATVERLARDFDRLRTASVNPAGGPVISLLNKEERRIRQEAQSALSDPDERLARELVDLLGTSTIEGGPSHDEAYRRVRSIGEELNATGGVRRMQSVGYRVAALGGPGRLLESAWHGIGEWLE